MKIYLAGPIRGLTYDEATDWREEAKKFFEALGHQTISPMRGKGYLKDQGRLFGDNAQGSYEKYAMSSAQGLFRRDIYDVANCDVILANFGGANELSLGTAMEIQRGYDLGKYVVTTGIEGTAHDHAFIRQASSIVVPTLDEAQYIIGVFGQPYR